MKEGIQTGHGAVELSSKAPPPHLWQSHRGREGSREIKTAGKRAGTTSSSLRDAFSGSPVKMQWTSRCYLKPGKLSDQVIAGVQ